MNRHRHRRPLPRRMQGVSMIEVLITMFVLLVGLLGVAAMSLASQRASMESFQRHQALMLLDDMVSRINANRSVADCYAVTDLDTGAPVIGLGSGTLAACSAGTVEAYTQANADLAQWDALLKGATVTDGGSNVGAMLGARGCVAKVADQEYLVTVVWQGLNATAAPSAGVTCAQGLYGDETLRRAVSLPLRLADLGGA